MKHCWLSCLLVCCSLLPARAQTFRSAFNRISTEDGFGLASDHILALHQDDKGYLWIGGANGMQRYDGHKFVNISTGGKPGSEELPAASVDRFLPADSGRFWVAATSYQQFGLFDPVRFTYRSARLAPSAPLPPRSEFKLWRDSKGNTYINVFRYGKILRYDPERNEFNEKTPLNNLPKGWKIAFNSFEDTVKRRYWLVCEQGLAVYDEASRQMWHKGFNPQQLPLLNNEHIQQAANLFFIDKQRRHWLFHWPGDQEFHCFNEQGLELTDTAGIRSSLRTYAELAHMRETRNGDIWVYGAANLFQLSKESHRFQFYRDQFLDNFGIRYEMVYDLLEARDGMVWIATDQGLYYTRGTGIQKGSPTAINMFLSQNPGEYEVTDLLELKSGDYWISTWGKGVMAMDRAFRRKNAPMGEGTVPAQLPQAAKVGYQQVWTMCQQKESGIVWLGCQAGLLMRYNPATGKTEYLHPPEFDNRTIRYITEDSKGRLWFGTQGGRVIKYEGNRFTVVKELEKSAIVYKVFADTDGWIWVAAQDRGVMAIDPDTGRELLHFTREDGGMYNNSPRDIEQLNDSLMYVSAEALHIINKRRGSLRVITTAQGLPSNSIRRIRMDARGYLWIITLNGLCRYDHTKDRFTPYGKKDGILLGTVTNVADYLCSENFVMFVGPNALMFFNPERYYNNPAPPNVTITDFLLGNRYLPIDSLQNMREVRLSADQNNFTISFACLDFINRDKYVYYYQLEGLDDAWIKADRLDLALAGLSPGRYTFRVKAENIDGLVSKEITSLRLYIQPPFWRTGWFLSSMLMLFTIIGYTMHRMRVNRLLAVEGIRNRVARDLHDDMGSTLSTINILSSMAKAKMHSDEARAVEYINKISDNSQRMMEAMDDIVWAIKPANDSMQKLVARLREFATQVFEAKDIDLSFVAGDEVNDVKLDMEARRDFFLIGKEAINNAAKYAKCSLVTIEVQVTGRELSLRVQDNGIGFDPQAADGGNGMGNMQRRAQALRGQLKINSKPGAGTEIILQVPLP
ncbi:MAG: histidine kinase [Chitinophagaceae bacterium]|nr:histidine kinase [Chitinophagaceae bacterium]